MTTRSGLKPLTGTNWKDYRLPDNLNVGRPPDPRTTGLHLLVRRKKGDVFSGKWELRYRPDHLPEGIKKRDVAVKSHIMGDRTTMTLQEAREKAPALLKQLKSGEDLRAEQKARQQEASARTMTALLDRYVKDMQDRGLERWRSQHNTIRNHLYWPARHGRDWRKRDISKIRRAEWQGSVEDIGADARQRLYAFLSFVLELGYIDENPLEKKRRRRRTRAEMQARTAEAEWQEVGGKSGRRLTPEELVRIWNATDDPLDPFHVVNRICMLTGCRRGEAVRMEWEWDEGDWIDFPAGVMKSGRPHRVFVTPLLREVLGPRDPERTGLRFPSRRGARSAENRLSGEPVEMSGFSALHKAVKETSGVDNWNSHCYRKTVTTVLREAGEIRENVRAFLGQRTAVDRLDVSYDFRTFDAVKKHIAQRWEAYIHALISGDNAKIVPFPGISESVAAATSSEIAASSTTFARTVDTAAHGKGHTKG